MNDLALESLLELEDFQCDKPSTSLTSDGKQSHEEKVLHSLYKFLKNSLFCDLTIKSEVTLDEFKVHSVVFAAASPYLCCHLDSFDYTSSQVLCILPVTPKCIQALVTYTYTGELMPGLQPEDMNDLHCVAKEWKMEELASLCKPLTEHKQGVNDDFVNDNDDYDNDRRSHSTKQNEVESQTHDSDLQAQASNLLSLLNAVPLNDNQKGDEMPADDKSFCGRGKYHQKKKQDVKKNQAKSLPPGVREERIERPFECKMCGADFADMASCKDHVVTSHSLSRDHVRNFIKVPSTMPKRFPVILPKRFCCVEEGCNYNSLTIYTVLCHRFRTHGIPFPEEASNRMVQCPECGIVMKGQTDLNDHLNTHRGINPYLCDICAMSFPRKSQLKKHSLTAHNMFIGDKSKEFPCPHCEFVTYNMSRLKRHTEGHKNKQMGSQINMVAEMRNGWTIEDHFDTENSLPVDGVIV